MHEGDGVKRITLPVRLVNGQWEFLYGGGIPVREGSYAELNIALHAIEDESFSKRVTQEVVVKVFEEGRPLIVALNDQKWHGPRHSGFKVALGDVPAGCTRFERVSIGPTSVATRRLDAKRGGLWMRQLGVGRCELACSSVLMPQDGPAAASLNHAVTKLSEQYETHRISHTGNVYERVFYQEGNGNWYPLAHLRSGVVAWAEQKIIVDAWAKLEEQLGWRPLPIPSGKKRKR